MSKIYDLEEKIMDCWSVTDDIDTTLSIIDRTACDEDAVCNALIGIKTLYQTKFELLFETFEEVVREYYKTKSLSYSTSVGSTITTSNTDIPSGTTTISFK
jgi:hypothetical protein